MLKIQTGEFRGKVLLVAKSARPTLNRIRPAIFNVLANLIHFPDYCFIDLFAGSGAVGLEALSRGFASAIFVEKDPEAWLTLQKNLHFLKADRAQAVAGDALKILPQLALPPNLARVWFFDPPYDYYTSAAFKEWVSRTAFSAPFGQEKALVIFQLDKRMKNSFSSHLLAGPHTQGLAELSQHFTLLKNKTYGHTTLLFGTFAA